MYQIYGDYGYISECLLEEFDDLKEAVQWADKYTKGGDLGGYNAVEVIRFKADGEAVTEWLLSTEDVD